MPRVLDEMDKKILEVSRELFLTKGIRETEMKDIAQRAGIGRSTLYRHFSAKELIAFYIAKDVLTSLKDYSEEKLTEKLVSSRKEIRFLDEFDQYFTDSYPESEEASEYIQFNKDKDMGIYQMFLEGMEDGSIRRMENPEFEADTLINSTIGFAQRIIPRREHYMEEHGFCEEMLEEAIKLMLMGLKA
jgi:AcrR family transcriptional regulator